MASEEVKGLLAMASIIIPIAILVILWICITLSDIKREVRELRDIKRKVENIEFDMKYKVK